MSLVLISTSFKSIYGNFFKAEMNKELKNYMQKNWFAIKYKNWRRKCRKKKKKLHFHFGRQFRFHYQVNDAESIKNYFFNWEIEKKQKINFCAVIMYKFLFHCFTFFIIFIVIALWMWSSSMICIYCNLGNWWNVFWCD